MRDHFVKLFQHLKWADASVLESLRSAHSVLKKDQDLYAHIVGAEHVWLSRIHGAIPKLAVWPALTLSECEQISVENAVGYHQLVSDISSEGLARPVTYRNSAGDEYTSTLEDILTHVALHGAYHRGQIAASVRAAGDTPIPTDYIAFARGAPAATRER
ncbi:MAG: damage-inducible protein DinB [Gemmatimonadota bacterium]|nr:damage-inducible protein DinB [Gemmatimonadota bacterium]